MVKREAYLANPEHQYRISQWGEHIVVPITKIMKIITSVQVCLSWQMNFGYKMVEKKAVLDFPKHQYPVSQWGEHNCSAYNKKNGDYYEYPSLSHFIDEH